ncbi:CPBP family intramembrane glutamic endopeptidase [Litchfieldia salsa]|uniref:CAAX protease self-immunity n=1 Tax=Litchfieldia salsa TaxID=930152 RepID=A0A1H0U0U1_9BACI|nr:CPBP family intramembrane glutamic endopeptidase [Litchfieldia salsa]SDP59655.1 CAAX protease self-immunity [Litchfieldia salsa]
MKISFSQFTKPVLVGMIFVTLGAELLLWGSGYSYFLNELYMYLIIASIFLAIPLHRAWRGQKTKRSTSYYIFQFCIVFFVFFTISSIVDLSTYSYLDEFEIGYDEELQDHLGNAPTFYEDGEYYEEEYEDYGTYPFFENLDYYGSDIWSCVLAGLEEVSRLSYILLTMCLFSFFYRQNKQDRSHIPPVLTGLFLSSLMFGLGHVWAHDYTLAESAGSFIYYTNAGLVLGVLLIWTKNLWMMIAVHGFYNLCMSLNLYLYEYSTLIIYLIVLVVCISYWIVLHRKRRRQKEKEIFLQKLHQFNQSQG